MAIYLKESNHLIMPSSQFLTSCLEGLLHIDFYGKFFSDHYQFNLVCHFYKVIVYLINLYLEIYIISDFIM